MSWLLLALLYLLIKLLLLAVGVGIGFLLRWLWPEVDLGIAMLIGVVATIGAVHFFGRLIMALPVAEELETEEETQEILESLVAHTGTIIDMPPPRRRRRKRR